LRAMGVSPELARAAVRASLGAASTAEEVDGFLSALNSTAVRLRRLTAMSA